MTRKPHRERIAERRDERADLTGHAGIAAGAGDLIEDERQRLRDRGLRELTESYKALDQIEAKVEAALAKRKNVAAKDQEYLFARQLEEELRKHGA